MPKGDCFSLALSLVAGYVHGDPVNNPDDQAPMPGGKVVHGLPIGRGPENMGKRYWHAWVEVVINGVVTVMDYSNDQRITMPRDEYYRFGNIQQVWRYNAHQARAQFKKQQRCGPWVKGWESMSEASEHRLAAEQAVAEGS
jgi:hypothetical protein